MLLDKPAGPTSHDMVVRVRRTLGIKAAGHTGTLDPFATGLLVILLGRATRLARFVEGQAKTYLATARLGRRTTTDDATGEPVGPEATTPAILEGPVRAALDDFLGTSGQRPPEYSAKWVDGERSHRRARRGEPVALADVSVTVHRIELIAFRPPDVTFRATVSAGTYVRALARDLGERLGVGAHLTALRREAVGALRVEEAVRPDELGPAAVRPAAEVLRHLPAARLSDADLRDVAHGRPVAAPADAAGPVALLHGADVVAMAEAAGGRLRPVVVLAGP